MAGRRRSDRPGTAPRTSHVRVPRQANEAERLFQERAARLGSGGKRTHAVEALQRVLGRDLGVPRDERYVGRRDDGELEPEAFGIVEAEPALGSAGGDPLRSEPRLPEVECVIGGHAKRDRVHHPRAGPAAAGAGYSKKVMSAPGLPSSSA